MPQCPCKLSLTSPFFLIPRIEYWSPHLYQGPKSQKETISERVELSISLTRSPCVEVVARDRASDFGCFIHCVSFVSSGGTSLPFCLIDAVICRLRSPHCGSPPITDQLFEEVEITVGRLNQLGHDIDDQCAHATPPHSVVGTSQRPPYNIISIVILSGSLYLRAK